MKIVRRGVSVVVLVCVLLSISVSNGYVKKAKAAAQKVAYTSKQRNVYMNQDAKKTWTVGVPVYTGPNGQRLTRPTVRNVSAWATVPKGTIVGTITVDGTIGRADSSPSLRFENYNVYEDAIYMRAIVVPLGDGIKVPSYRCDLDGKTVTYGNMTFYAASELLTFSFGNACRFGTQMTSGMMSSNPNQPEGGIYIHSYDPSASSIGSSSYSIYLGYPWSISHSVNFNVDFCKTTDKTNAGLYSYGASFDYKKWSGAQHICVPDRQNVIFKKTVQKGACAWYTTDKTYNMTLTANYSITLCEGKSEVYELKNGTTTCSVVQTFMWPSLTKKS